MARPRKEEAENQDTEQIEQEAPKKQSKPKYNGLTVEEWSCRVAFNKETRRWEVVKKIEMLRNNIKIDQFTFDRMNSRIGQHNNIAYFIQEQ